MPVTEWGIFIDESEDWTAEQALEAQFYSREAAEARLAEAYAEEDATVHEVEPEEEEEEEEC